MKSLNQTQLIGNLVKSPDLKQSASGNSIVSFTLAMNRSVKNGDTWEEATDYVDCVSFGKQADMIHEYVGKGKKLFVQGRIQTRSYEQNGQTKYRTEVVVNDVVFMDAKGTQSTSSPTQTPSKDVVLEDIDDTKIDLSAIPF